MATLVWNGCQFFLERVSISFGTVAKFRLEPMPISFGTVAKFHLEPMSISFGTVAKFRLEQVSIFFGTTVDFYGICKRSGIRHESFQKQHEEIGLGNYVSY